MANYYIDSSGNLLRDSAFFSGRFPITGIKVTELWCDSYQMNFEKGDEVLFPGDLSPFELIEHKERKNEFIEKGGGFRLDFKVKL